MLFVPFENQLKSLRYTSTEQFEKKMRSLVSKDNINEQFSLMTSKFYEDAINAFKKSAVEFIIEGSDWGEQVNQHMNELKSQLKHSILELREKELLKLANITEKTVCD